MKKKEKKMFKEYYESKLLTYRVEFTGKNNDNIYLQEWFREFVIAENGKQAIEFLKHQLNITGNNPENYIYTIKGIETVCLFWYNEPVKVYMAQKPVFDEETAYYLYKTEDGRWIAHDDAIDEWVQIRG